MGRLAIIGGHSILGTSWRSEAPRVEVDTDDGPVAVLNGDDAVLLQRHGIDRFVSAPHIDHRAHIRALESLGCDRILGLASVGSLRADLPVGSVLVPDDFIALHLGITFFDDSRGHQVPGFDPGWRDQVIEAWKPHGALIDRGVYWQSVGPRFETPAEIRLVAAHADVVGMTVASEAILARELGISYAAVCTVDNMANGLEAEPLTIDAFSRGATSNSHRVTDTVDSVVGELA